MIWPNVKGGVTTTTGQTRLREPKILRRVGLMHSSKPGKDTYLLLYPNIKKILANRPDKNFNQTTCIVGPGRDCNVIIVSPGMNWFIQTNGFWIAYLSMTKIEINTKVNAGKL